MGFGIGLGLGLFLSLTLGGETLIKTKYFAGFLQ
jgi:hypothetical protein